MRRVYTTLLMFILGAGFVAAQDSTFRYASDPFAEEIVSAVEEAATPAEDAANVTDSFESFDSLSLVQKKAMHRAQQRQLRIQARKWYGHSQSRPLVYANPYMTTYSPMWMNRSWMTHAWRPQRIWDSTFLVLGDSSRLRHRSLGE